MPQVQYCICSFCKSVNQNEAYKLNRKNFGNFRFELNTNDPLQPMKMYNGVICKACQDLPESPIKPIIVILETARTNDAEIQAELNQ